MWVFVKVVEQGSFVCVVELLEIFNVVVMCFIVDFEVYLGICLFNCLICCFLFMEVGQVYLEWVYMILVEVDDVEVLVFMEIKCLVGMLVIYFNVGFGQL